MGSMWYLFSGFRDTDLALINVLLFFTDQQHGQRLYIYAISLDLSRQVYALDNFKKVVI